MQPNVTTNHDAPDAECILKKIKELVEPMDKNEIAALLSLVERLGY